MNFNDFQFPYLIQKLFCLFLNKNNFALIISDLEKLGANDVLEGKIDPYPVPKVNTYD